jgi:uncharacterized protein (TIGR02118 family)
VAKLVVLYTKPDDPEGFDEHYRSTHAPLARNVPGASWSLTRMTGTPRGGEPAYYLMAEASFASDEMRETGKDAAQIVQRFGCEATMLVGGDYA